MDKSSQFIAYCESGPPEVLWEDGERLCHRIHSAGPDGAKRDFVAVLPAAEVPSPDAINRLAHEYSLKDYLDSTWAVRPLELVRERGQTLLVIEHPNGEPLSRLIGSSKDIGQFLQIAVALSTAVGQLHARGLIHKDVKPSNILVNPATGEVWLTGFGVTSRLPQDRQTPVPSDSIASALAYMFPEQTGRMNRSIDTRSHLYSLGIALYQMLTRGASIRSADPPVSARDIIRHRLNRHVRGEWARRFPLNPSESHIPDPLALRSFIDRIRTPA